MSAHFRLLAKVSDVSINDNNDKNAKNHKEGYIRIKKNKKIQIMKIEHADHGLEVPDVNESITILSDYIKNIALLYSVS